MIAACPKCSARYRVDRDKLSGGGVRLRCTRCEAVFRVRAPEAAPAAAAAPTPARPAAPAAAAAPAKASPPAPAAPPSDAPLVIVALPDAELGKHTGSLLEAHGLHAFVVQDGVEAMLEIQRRTPRAVLLGADLPKMYGFQVCEVIKRNESLRDTFVVLAGAIHHPDRYRRPPGELYGADAYVEVPDLPEGLLPLLQGAGLPLASGGGPAPAPRPARVPGPPTPAFRPAPPRPAPAPPPAASVKPAAPAAAPQRAAQPAPGLDDERAKAERLARIIVSDIILYNEEKFAGAVARGDVASAMEGDLAEGRTLFQERIDGRVREERDYLVDELVRVARLRGMR